MKKLLVILLLFISYNSYALYLTCDGGTQKLGILADSEPGDDFEIEVTNGLEFIIDDIFWCRGIKSWAGYLENQLLSSCKETETNDGVDTVYSAAIDISRRTGSYSYDWQIWFDGENIFRMMQTGKCRVSEQKLF
jgi:hypothetical protein